MPSTELIHTDDQGVGRKIDPTTAAEVPSAAWGWSGESPKAAKIAGWVVVVFLLIMLIGNHTGHVEDLFLLGFAAAIAGILVRDSILKRHDR